MRVFMLFLRILPYILSLIFVMPTHALLSQNNQASQEVWESLKKGNKKFMRSPKYAKQRSSLVTGQNPACIILSCSDSRVPPEIVFQQGLGDVFTVRTAGQVVDDVVVDTIEYAVTHFDVKLILVMGHQECGAVIGALKHLKENGGKIDPSGQGHLYAVLIPIETAIVQAGIDIYAPDALQQSIRANISYEANQLISSSEPIAQAVKQGKLVIKGAEYHLKSGKVLTLFDL